MAENTCTLSKDSSICVEPDQRVTVLARTLQSEDRDIETAPVRGNAGLGRALYRHRSVFRGDSRAPVWSHLELTYFDGIVSFDAVRDLVIERPPAGMRLLRAEILLTIPSSFVLPSHALGRPGRWRPSLEYIDVRSTALDEYRDVMRRYIGPAASKLVAMGRIGTFRAMETAAVLYQDRFFDVEWNQIHLSDVDPDGFEGFGQEFDAALRELSPDGGFVSVFAGLDRIRAIPRWTFNDAVMETGFAAGHRESSAFRAGGVA